MRHKQVQYIVNLLISIYIIEKKIQNRKTKEILIDREYGGNGHCDDDGYRCMGDVLKK